MTDASAFNNPIRRQEAAALQSELVIRLHQRGVRIDDSAPADELADLLSVLDEFEVAVEEAGGDPFVNAPDSSQPERPEFVIPHPYDDESVKGYTKRVQAAAARLRRTKY